MTRLKALATGALLALIWGTTWAAIRVGLGGIPPLTGVALRFAIASVVLLGASRVLKVRLGATRTERTLWVVNGVLSFAISYGVIYWCEQRVPSGLAAVLFATFPLFVALLAHVALPHEPLRARVAAGVLLAFGGVVVIFSEDLAKLAGPGVPFAAAVSLTAPLVSAFASVAVKRWGKGIHPLSITAIPMAIGASLTGALSLVAERGRPLVLDRASLAALLYLAIAGSAVTFTLYYWLLAHVPATKVALIAYVSPVVAVAIGALLLDEPYTPRMLAGSALVLAGVALSTLRWRTAAAFLACLAAASSLNAQEATAPLRIPDDPAPPAVRALGPLEERTAFALSADANGAAAAFPAAKGKRSTLRIAAGDAARAVDVAGVVRALRFDPDGRTLYAIVATPEGARGVAQASLVRFDPGESRPKREFRLPASAADLDVTSDGAGLIVACTNELRVVLIPDLRSAPLFRVPGENLALAMVPGSSSVLVGRRDGILRVDVADPQGRDGLPGRGSVATKGAVVALAVAPDASAALARLDDGRALAVALDPLAVRELGVSTAIAWPGTRIAYRAPEEAPPPPGTETTAEAAPPSAPEPPPGTATTTEAEPPSAPAPPPAMETTPQAETAPSQPVPVPKVDLGPPVPIPPLQAEPPPLPAAPAPETGFARGRVEGPLDRVRGVIVLGPDNVLKEAARAPLGPDGSWSVGPLAPGHYRVVVDAGTAVAITEPAFGAFLIEGKGVDAPLLRVRSLRSP